MMEKSELHDSSISASRMEVQGDSGDGRKERRKRRGEGDGFDFE
jgi:hypothetical protein